MQMTDEEEEEYGSDEPESNPFPMDITSLPLSFEEITKVLGFGSSTPFKPVLTG